MALNCDKTATTTTPTGGANDGRRRQRSKIFALRNNKSLDWHFLRRRAMTTQTKSRRRPQFLSSPPSPPPPPPRPDFRGQTDEWTRCQVIGRLVASRRKWTAACWGPTPTAGRHRRARRPARLAPRAQSKAAAADFSMARGPIAAIIVGPGPMPNDSAGSRISSGPRGGDHFEQKITFRRPWA